MNKSSNALLLSICIPTFNRSLSLDNCLNSILIAKRNTDLHFEVCISDNHSSDNTTSIVKKYLKKLPIKFKCLRKNKGRVFNYLNVVNLASGEFVWFIGDDDLLLPNALNEFARIQSEHILVDFFYINSFNLNNNFLDKFPKPFDTKNLPIKMTKFTSYNIEGNYKFVDLINPNISFDFLGGFFMSIFRRSYWLKHTGVLEPEGYKLDEFSNIKNTFPHAVVFAQAFSSSHAYYFPKPLTVNLYGLREWDSLFPLVRSFRLPQLLKIYKKNGLPLFQYLKCMNSALSFFMPDLLMMLFNYRTSGIKYVGFKNDICFAMLYPNAYFSVLRLFSKKAFLRLISLISHKI
jgi:glycosyltransferase involved in cell wall biosynthesis